LRPSQKNLRFTFAYNPNGVPMSLNIKSNPKVDWQVESLFKEKALWGVPFSALAGFALILSYILLKVVVGLKPDVPAWGQATVRIFTYASMVYTLYALCRILLHTYISKQNEEQYFRYFDLSRAPFLGSGALVTAALLLLFNALALDWTLHQNPTINIFLFSPLAILLAIDGLLLLKYYINDYFKRTLKYASYFYPSVISIIVLAFVISKQEQFDSFFIEMMGSFWNLLIFSILFFVSIIVVWFAPSYLLFTDDIHFSPEDETEKAGTHPKLASNRAIRALRILAWLFGKMLAPVFCRPQDKTFYYELIWRHKSEIKESFKVKESRGFKITRIVLGLIYIATLTTLAGRVYLKSRGVEYVHFTTHIALLSFILPTLFAYIHLYKYQHKKQVLHREASAYPRHTARMIWRIYVSAFIFPLVIVLGSVYIDEGNWLLSLGLFVVVALITTATFTKVALFLHTDKEDHLRLINRNFVSSMLMANANVAIIAVLAFILLLLLPFHLTYPVLEWTNTINLYLLLVNGFIAFLTILDRYLKIRDKIKAMQEGTQQPGKKQSTASSLSWALLVMVLALAYYFNQQGNDYHQVPYQSVKTAEDQSINLEQYTQRFLARLNTDTANMNTPVICIAADGGGLKAAYWTMNILLKLDSMGLYDDQVFMMSGASGGSIGQGLYSYMKSRGLSFSQITEVVKRLGQTNFISGDLGGLLTRWPMNYIPDIGNTVENRHDRMEAMAAYYFNLIQEVGGLSESEWSYEALRQKPYHELWSRGAYQLPLFITNTARAEDGIKGWSHPLRKDPYLEAGIVDLTRRIIDGDTAYISFPDALFLTNRFPIMSPAARIYAKGHFVDAGAIDNSGMGSIIQVLQKMKGREDDSEVFCNFFNRKIIIISIRNDRSRFIYSQFTDLARGCLGKTFRRSELNSFFGTVVSAGITGEPKVFDEIVRSGEVKAILGIDTLYEVALPFRLNQRYIDNTYNRLFECAEVKQVQQEILKKINSINREIEVLNGRPVVEPPLGRLISEPARNYMDNMLRYSANKEVWEALAN